jgi:hypothetical protein
MREASPANPGSASAPRYNPDVRLLLDERIGADGAVSRTWGTADAGYLHVAADDGAHGKLSADALDRVMVRYGKELDAAIALDGDALELGAGRRLRRLRHHAPVDATGRDYLVWERAGEPPLAAIATGVTAALRYLVLRLASAEPQESEGG